jgi:rhamnose utilization protein RhaD (predicted bifunctional aldolase and dehydrogenase)|uniref:Uncharacterized protein n=1 Tax=uncultured marine virus TaxID=186617 RepID=A0A0F7L4M4_9VIRU|nr:hypothetical protein [uncultured marine virus]
MNKKSLCEALSEDYADKVARAGGNYDDAYNHYLERCKHRSEKDLLDQYKTAGLDSSGFIF